MNIKNRLKKMEGEVIKTGSEFCFCEKEIQTIVILPSLNGKQNKETKEFPPMPEYCKLCGKRNAEPVESTLVIKPKE